MTLVLNVLSLMLIGWGVFILILVFFLPVFFVIEWLLRAFLRYDARRDR